MLITFRDGCILVYQGDFEGHLVIEGKHYQDRRAFLRWNTGSLGVEHKGFEFKEPNDNYEERDGDYQPEEPEHTYIRWEVCEATFSLSKTEVFDFFLLTWGEDGREMYVLLDLIQHSDGDWDVEVRAARSEDFLPDVVPTREWIPDWKPTVKPLPSLEEGAEVPYDGPRESRFDREVV